MEIGLPAGSGVPAMKERSYLVFSDDFGKHPSSCQHIFRNMPGRGRILWVNTVGLRSPRLTRRDLIKAATKAGNMLKGLVTPLVHQSKAFPESIHVCQPFMLPFNHLAGVRRLNRFFVAWTVKTFLVRLKMEKPVLVITAPNACDYIGLFDEEISVYYCVDDYSGWPGHDRRLVSSMETKLLEKADVFIATSEKLRDRIAQRGKDVLLLSHGVDVSHFARRLPPHPFLDHIPVPRVGYFGLFDGRSDLQLLEAIADRLPKLSFVITGAVEVDVSSLKQRPNVFFTGPVSYDELPSMTSGWDACFLPYKVNAFTDNIQPLKLKEYLATGKPVVTTPIKEARKLKDLLLLANSVEEWVSYLGNLHAVRLDPRLRVAFLARESWKEKAVVFFDYCESHLREQNGF